MHNWLKVSHTCLEMGNQSFSNSPVFDQTVSVCLGRRRKIQQILILKSLSPMFCDNSSFRFLLNTCLNELENTKIQKNTVFASKGTWIIEPRSSMNHFFSLNYFRAHTYLSFYLSLQSARVICQRNSFLLRDKYNSYKKMIPNIGFFKILIFHLVFNKCLINSSRNLQGISLHTTRCMW